MSTIFEGVGKPKITFNNATFYIFPEPVGAEKEGLRLYGFDTFFRDQYWSERGIRNNVGKKFIFTADLKWLSLEKAALKELWKAQRESSFTLIPNVDKTSINFKCEIVFLRYRFFKGIPGHRAGYSVEVKFRGAELLNNTGYFVSGGTTGWGTDWGGNAENQ